MNIKNEAAGAPGDAAITVMVVDDSSVIRAAMTRLLESDPAIRVVAQAADGHEAVLKAGRLRPGIIVLDIEMPVQDGLKTLPLLLAQNRSTRVLMASTLTTRGADITVRALRLGAADYVAKPESAAVASDTFRQELLAKVKTLGGGRAVPAAGVAAIRLRPEGLTGRPALLAIGSSTGGPRALFTLVEQLGSVIPVPIVVTQHMPAAFTPRLATQLDQIGTLPCREAADGDRLSAGTLYLAPGGQHLLIEGQAPSLRARLSLAEPENFCRPSVDVMLRAAAASCPGGVIVTMLTGMGRDGLAGTRAVIASGGVALAQDEATSVVWGMPKAIAQEGLCQAVLPLDQLAGRIRAMVGAERRS